jgi:hypothetical protein
VQFPSLLVFQRQQKERAMTITTKNVTLEITGGGLFFRLPILGEVFIDLTGQGLTCWSRPYESRIPGHSD